MLRTQLLRDIPVYLRQCHEHNVGGRPFMSGKQLSGYQTIIDTLRKTGDTAESTGKQTGAVDLAETLTRIDDAYQEAMPPTDRVRLFRCTN